MNKDKEQIIAEEGCNLVLNAGLRDPADYPTVGIRWTDDNNVQHLTVLKLRPDNPHKVCAARVLVNGSLVAIQGEGNVTWQPQLRVKDARMTEKDKEPKFVWQQEQVDALVCWMVAVEENQRVFGMQVSCIETNQAQGRKKDRLKTTSVEPSETSPHRQRFQLSVKGIPTCHKCGQEHPTEPEKALTQAPSTITNLPPPGTITNLPPPPQRLLK